MRGRSHALKSITPFAATQIQYTSSEYVKKEYAFLSIDKLKHTQLVLYIFNLRRKISISHAFQIFNKMSEKEYIVLINILCAIQAFNDGKERISIWFV